MMISTLVGCSDSQSNDVVGSDSAKVNIFYGMPRGEITIAFEQSRIQFSTLGDNMIYVLPKMDFSSQDSSWLVVEKKDYYEAGGHDDICIHQQE